MPHDPVAAKGLATLPGVAEGKSKNQRRLVLLQNARRENFTLHPTTPAGPQALLFSHTDRVIRLDPGAAHRATVEGRLRPLLAKAWGTSAPRGVIAAYNDMLPLVDPTTGRTVSVMGVEGRIEAGDKDKTYRPNTFGGWYAGGTYLIRDDARRYRVQEVNGRWQPGKPPLVSPRTIVLSPFLEDAGRGVYFGGFDANFFPASNTAWVFRAPIEIVPSARP